MEELEQQKQQMASEMEEIKMRFGGDLEDVTERLQVDLRTHAGLEGYRKNLGSELETVKRKLTDEGSRDSAGGGRTSL